MYISFTLCNHIFCKLLVTSNTNKFSEIISSDIITETVLGVYLRSLLVKILPLIWIYTCNNSKCVDTSLCVCITTSHVQVHTVIHKTQARLILVIWYLMQKCIAMLLINDAHVHLYKHVRYCICDIYQRIARCIEYKYIMLTVCYWYVCISYMEPEFYK